MSKCLIRDDDAIELMDFLFELSYNDSGDFDSNTSSKADYLFEKLCVLSRRNPKEYFDLLIEHKRKFQKEK